MFGFAVVTEFHTTQVNFTTFPRRLAWSWREAEI